ncbi:MAG TPA: alpha/beta hydrolase [Chitinophagales bacterium]|nr:alpha/beta hydrolase [Chitinophagales bacterium]
MITQTTMTIIKGSGGEKILIKYLIPDALKSTTPVVIMHGFKGFMNWGHFPLVAMQIAENGHPVVMFNFSHNGTAEYAPDQFVKMKLFSENTYSREVEDIGFVLNEIENSAFLKENGVNGSQVTLIGHSRGGGVAILKASQDARVQKLITWAAVGSFGSFFGQNEDLLEEWKTKGVISTFNSRTQQEMPMKYDLYEDVLLNQDKLDVQKAATQISIPWLIIHGADDPTIPVDVAYQFHEIQPNSELFIMENAHHNFGGKHPLDETADMDQIQLLMQQTLNFIEK